MASPSRSPRTIGNIIAPPRFVAYALMLLAAAGVALMQGENRLHAFLIGFDIATGLFLASLLPLLWVRDHADLAAHAEANDANRALMLFVGVFLSLVVMAVVFAELKQRDAAGTAPLALVSLALAWLSGNAIYALHYAHLFYSRKTGTTGFAEGLKFPSADTPDYRDFLHFSLILGMTFQTADIDITSPRIRWVSTGQCIAAFIFNLGILAFSINMLAS